MIRLILPPSETKREGGAPGSALDLSQLAFPELTAARAAVVDAAVELAGDAEATVRALKLGPKQADEVARNREIATSPTMPALHRYTGVLYDALDAPSLPEDAWERARRSVLVHSALLGPVGAGDPVPAYRLSHDSRLPGLPLKRHWRADAAAALAALGEPVLDLRSEGYVGLGPLDGVAESAYLRVVAEGPDGRRRALNHFNKQGKGRFVRRLLLDGAEPRGLDELLDWAAGDGVPLERTGERELTLVAEH
ncbi:YaaA family protein [Arenivirga flava]|uniref:Peroxide stress protein YaaA n=1 Tax=Arenivirga flava TaxID=1930060 RepID=A0AA37UKI2_9MICO|nr:peroxide stress protein YaaA [Arenivirga flava]